MVWWTWGKGSEKLGDKGSEELEGVEYGLGWGAWLRSHPPIHPFLPPLVLQAWPA